MTEATQGGGSIAFRATLLLAGRTATGIHVPDEVVAALAAGRRPKVLATLRGYTYRSSLAPMRGRFMLPVSADVREGACIAAGDEVEVVVALDTEPRKVEMPDDFAVALGHGDVRSFYEALSYSNQRRFVLSIEGAKTAATRQRRIEKAVEALREGRHG